MSKKERRPHNLSKDGIMGEMGQAGLPVLLRFARHVKIFFNPGCFQVEGEPLEECLETTSVLSPSLSGNLIYLQV